MKDGLENSFKEALNEFEYAYDANAWKSMSKKLPKKFWYQSTSLKWSAASVLIVAGLIAVFTTNKKADKNDVQKQQESSLTRPNVPAKTQEPQPIFSQEKIDVFGGKEEIVKNAESTQETAKTLENNALNAFSNSEFLTNQSAIISEIQSELQAKSSNDFHLLQSAGVIIDFKNRCQGEVFQNDLGKYACRVVYAGKTSDFSYNETISMKLTEVGKFTLYGNSGPYGQFEEFGSFDVQAVPSLSLGVDQSINYEDGLPKMLITAETTEDQITWHSNMKLMHNEGKSNELLCFSKGKAIIEAQVISANGCKTTEKAIVTIPDDYNLLAVNAFNPQSMDARNSTFMPYALIARQIAFKLIVLDPDNGGLIFESSESGNAWDGIDRRNGKMSPTNKAYIWKVVLQNPQYGEKSTYTGTIVRM